MKKHLIDPKTHGILDYAISGILIGAPTVLGLRGGARNISMLTGATEALVNTFTDHSVSASRQIKLKNHRRMDILSLAGTALFSLMGGIWKNPKARNYYLVILAIGIANVVLTDWDADSKE